jgi:aryl-alcohol dehydrogenase-like predicted oxidoreductase
MNTGTVSIGGDLTVGRIGYGAMQLTGPKVWGDFPDRDHAIALLRQMVAEGVTFVGTADVYGPHSDEELIHDALHPYPDGLVIATKGRFVRGGPEFSDLGAVLATSTSTTRTRRRCARGGRGRRYVFSPWHPGAIPQGDEGKPFRAVIDPIAAAHGATAQQVALQ